ncbi:hypothetical protein Cni_G10176 [Canna indica]|uniref:Uncharacterized protein n=1 Tax=Canna indica TaxID=4628 RepID=A0AAQ3K5N7_9LILI|nr:hypothetical protein Cni_G10176 [Canna indica]
MLIAAVAPALSPLLVSLARLESMLEKAKGEGWSRDGLSRTPLQLRIRLDQRVLEHDILEISTKHIPKHRHECGGVHWSFVLPPNIVLAARVMVASIESWKAFGRTSSPLDYLDLVNNYSQNSSLYKLELHIYAVVLLHCLHKYYNSDFPFSGISVGQLILVISQVKVNSMAEDNVAEAFVRIGKFELAVQHCIVSIKVYL